MKNFVKKGIIVLGTIFALLGVGGTVAFASGYITWGGSGNFEQAMANLDLISERGRVLKSERDELGNSNEQLQNVIKDKDNVIKNKDNKINSLEQDIKALKEQINGGQTTQDQLKQAEKDMQDVKNKSQEVLNEFN